MKYKMTEEVEGVLLSQGLEGSIKPYWDRGYFEAHKSEYAYLVKDWGAPDWPWEIAMNLLEGSLIPWEEEAPKKGKYKMTAELHYLMYRSYIGIEDIHAYQELGYFEVQEIGSLVKITSPSDPDVVWELDPEDCVELLIPWEEVPYESKVEAYERTKQKNWNASYCIHDCTKGVAAKHDKYKEVRALTSEELRWLLDNGFEPKTFDDMSGGSVDWFERIIRGISLCVELSDESWEGSINLGEEELTIRGTSCLDVAKRLLQIGYLL